MFARSTTIQAQPSAINMGIEHVRDVVMPALEEMDGFLGLSLLVDRQSARCICTSSWESLSDMQRSAERVWPVRYRAVEVFGGSAVVDQWEIAALHRAHRSAPGACVRATWLRTRPELFKRGVDFYRWAVLPAVEEFEGFCSASLLVDPTSARAVVSVTYDSYEAMEHCTESARSLRTAMMRDLGLDQEDVGEFELALAHLRVPELV